MKIFQEYFLLSMIVMTPLLVWGIWIVSEESFDELNSGNGFRRLKLSFFPKSYENSKESLRNFRKKYLPAYFMLITSFIVLVTVIVATDSAGFIQILAIVLLVSAFVIYSHRRDKNSVDRLSKEIEAEIPTQIQLLTILISSGMSPVRAISVLSTRSESLSSQALKKVVVDVENGASIIEALDKLKEGFNSNSLRRFVTSLILGIERGSALSPILISQVRDSRLSHKTEVMKRAGKAEIGLMIPVVFLILPISILFALWPSYQQLGSFI